MRRFARVIRYDGKYYIGMHSTDDLDDEYFGSGQLLWKSIKKHGKEKHTKEILEHLSSRETLKLRERELVNEEILDDKLCMNLKLGGEGGWEHITPLQKAAGGRARMAKLTTEERKKGLTTRIERYGDPFLGHRKDRTGVLHDPATKQKISRGMQGKQDGNRNSQYGTCWVTNQTISKKIALSELQAYLDAGFLRGRVLSPYPRGP